MNERDIAELELSNPTVEVTVSDARRVSAERLVLECAHQKREIVWVCGRAFFECRGCGALKGIE
jgi:hypothetical protein